MADLYKVQRIIGKRIRDSKFVEYKVKWQGYPSSQSTWEPVKHLKTVQNLIEEFQIRNKDKLPPNTIIKPEQKPSKFGSTLKKKMEDDKPVPKATSSKEEESKNSKKQVPSKEVSSKVRSSARLKAHNQSKESKRVTEDLDIEDIDIEDDIDNLIQTSNGSEKDGLLDANLELIALKIQQAAQQKKKGPKIVDISKRPDGIYYLTEDHEGKKEFKDKQYVLKHLSNQLIEFYQSKVPVSQTLN